MVVELSGPVEEQLRELAKRRGREIGALVEEAVRDYLEADSITDLDSAAVGETQMAMMSELPSLPPVTRSLLGIAAGSRLDEEDDHRHPMEKHR